MEKLISTILSFSMLFGTGTTSPLSTQLTARVPIDTDVQMAIYERYQDNTIYTDTVIKGNQLEMYWYFQGNDMPGFRGDADWYKEYELYTSYELKPSGIKLAGSRIAKPICVTHDKGPTPTAKYVYYKDEDGSIWSIEHVIGIHSGGEREEAMYKTMLTRKTTPRRGDFIELITEKSDTLPQNGVADDGFWYVFKNLVED